MFKKNSVMCTGVEGFVFTDENGESFLLNCRKLSSGEYDRLLFASRIRRLGSNVEITEQEQKIIISKVLELTPDIKWQIPKKIV